MLTIAFWILFICQNIVQTKMFPLFNDLFVITELKGEVLIKYTAHLLHTLAN